MLGALPKLDIRRFSSGVTNLGAIRTVPGVSRETNNGTRNVPEGRSQSDAHPEVEAKVDKSHHTVTHTLTLYYTLTERKNVHWKQT